MSRAYRISVSETVRRVIHAEDHVSTQLEILDVLPCDQMTDLLAAELEGLGFERDGDEMVRKDGPTTVTVDLPSATVTVTNEAAKEVKVSGKKTGVTYDDYGPSTKEAKAKVKESLTKELESNVDEKEAALQKKITDELESTLSGLRKELDQAVNRVTATALKQKAAQIGQIKELTEDPESGSLTIVVEV